MKLRRFDTNQIQLAEDARNVANQLEEIRAMHARDCAASGDVTPQLAAAAAKARQAEKHAARLEAIVAGEYGTKGVAYDGGISRLDTKPEPNKERKQTDETRRTKTMAH